jgi:methyl acetate hydrolase
MTPTRCSLSFDHEAVTGVTVMQLVGEGKISLSDRRRSVPAIVELRVLEGFDATGQPKTRPPKRHHGQRPHPSHVGLCYECFSADDLKYRGGPGVLGFDLHRRVVRTSATPGTLDL